MRLRALTRLLACLALGLLGWGLGGGGLAAAQENQWTVIDNMKNPSDWSTYTDPGGSVLRLRSVPGETPDQKALELAYEFGKGAYAIATKHGRWNLANMEELRIRLKGSGQADNFEVKFTDERGVVFMVRRVGALADAAWHDLRIPKKEFAYSFGGINTKAIDWSRIQTLDLTMVSGGINPPNALFVVVQDISAFLGKKEIKQFMVIDDYKDSLPINHYRARSAPNSSMEYNRSRNTFIGMFSLELSYVLGDISTAYSWTRLEAISQRSLNWVTVDKIQFYFLGDGSGNHIDFFVEDLAGQMAVAPLDASMRLNIWQTVTLDRGSFQRATSGDVDWKQLRSFGLLIHSNPGEVTGRNQGKIYLEEVKVLGRELASAFELSPWVAAAPEYFLENFSFYGFSKTEFFAQKDQPNSITQTLPLTVLGNFNQFSFNYEITAIDTQWGTDKGGFTSLHNPIESANLRVDLHKLVEGVELVELGNLWVDLSKHLFSTNSFIKNTLDPGNGTFTWGLKGIRVNGWLPAYGLNHDTYFLKHVDDSYSLINQLIWNDPLSGLKVSNLVVDYQHIPFTSLGSTADLSDVSDVFEIYDEIPGTNRLVTLTLRGGIDSFTTTQRALIGINTQNTNYVGVLAEAELSARGFMNSPVDLLLSGRHADPNFKPFFRDSPWFYDSDTSDQNEGRVRATYNVNEFVHPYVEAEYLQRISNDNYARQDAKVGVDLTSAKVFNTTLEVKYLDDDYFYYNPDFALKGLTVQLANETSWNTTWKLNAYITEALQAGFEYTYRYVWDRWDFFYTNEQELTLKGSYYLSNNANLNLEYNFKKYRVYGRDQTPAEEADPTYQKNYTRLWLRLSF